MQSRTVLTTILTITLLFTIYNLYYYSGTYMALTPDAPRSFESLSSLQFTLEQIPSPKSGIPAMRVHLRNSSPSPFTILTWGTPFDASALSQNVFRMTDLETNEPILSPAPITISRVQPPPKADFLEIPAHGEIVHEVALNEKWIPKRKLKIRASGRWHAVWEKKMSDLSHAEMDLLKGSMRDEFHVREAEFDLTPQRGPPAGGKGEAPGSGQTGKGGEGSAGSASGPGTGTENPAAAAVLEN